MKTSDFDYRLPPELIAQKPIEPRDHSKMMVLTRADGSIRHSHVYDLPDLLERGDVLVFNDSKVIPARLTGVRGGTGAKVEVLLLHRLSPGLWRALVKPGRRLGPGAVVEIPDAGTRCQMLAEVLEVEADGARIVRLTGEEHIDSVGAVPLPPYIHEPLTDARRYQTVYARVEGSIAAPTAGLHFTPVLLDGVRALGVETVFVTLHVGWGSFRPVQSDDIQSHKMHVEYWELSEDAAGAINQARQEGRRVISVGTTAVRLLEQAAALSGEKDGALAAGSGWADLFILPDYRFRVVDALLTNFHLPRSTLLMLTSAFGGHDLTVQAYREAVDRHYRFYSFGDCMIIL